MFELDGEQSELKMIDFGTTKDGKRKVLFQLPVLGQPGVPMGLMSAFGIFYDQVQSGRKLTDQQVAQSWSYFIQTLADSYPDATRQMARLDETQLKAVIEHWVRESDGYDPKA
jgi:hypothetical protein